MDWTQFILFMVALGSMNYLVRKDAKEKKSFNERLCTLEEKYQQMMQRFMLDKK